MLARRRFVSLAAASALAPPFAGRAGAQGYPNRYVRLIVPFPPGGGTDPIARVLANRLAEIWGQQVVIENRGGAGGNLGAQAAPDGYTILFVAPFLATNPFFYNTLGYDSIADFAPVTLICTFPNLMVVPVSSPVKSVAEFIAYAKANRGKVTFSSSGVGTLVQLCGELFKRMAGIEMIHVPYRGAGPALNDLIPGRVDTMFATMPSALPLARSGALRALAVTSATRVDFAPEIPTVAESGLPGFDVSLWYALSMPGRTPAEIVQKVHGDTVAALAHPPVRQRLGELGATIVTTTPAGYAAHLQAEMAKWGPVIKEAGVKPEG
jgi:tripartite-type tricarboxylate transporter receptor subunit TctC